MLHGKNVKRSNQTANQHYYIEVQTTIRQRVRIPVLEHPLYSPVLSPSDFLLFSKVKSVLKGTTFETVEAMKQKATETMTILSKNDFKHYFDQ